MIFFPRSTTMTAACLSLVITGSLTAAPAEAQVFDNPVGPTSLIGLIDNVTYKLTLFAAPVALLALVYGGTVLIFGGFGETGRRGGAAGVKRAKTIIFWALIGLSVIIMRSIIVALLQGDILGQPGVSPIAESDLLPRFKRIINIILSLTGALALAAVIWGGVLITASFGDEARVRQGKTAATYGLIGLAVTIFSFTLIELVVFIFS